MGRDIHFCECGTEIFDTMVRCALCEQLGMEIGFADLENPVWDGPDPTAPLEKLNTENAGE